MVRDRGELVEDYPGMCQKHSGFSPEIWVLGNGIKWGGQCSLSGDGVSLPWSLVREPGRTQIEDLYKCYFAQDKICIFQ